MSRADAVRRQRAWGVLQEREERFKAFMDNTPAVAFMKDDTGRYCYVNRSWRQSFQLTAAKALGKTDAELWPSEVARQLQANDRKVFTTAKTLEVVEIVPTPDGVPHSWKVLKFPLRNAAGRCFLGGVAVDISQHKQAQEDLQKAQAQTEQLLASISSILIGVNPSGIITKWNAVAESVFGIPAADAIGRLLADCGIRWDPTTLLQGIATCRATDRLTRLSDIRFIRPDGSEGFLGLTINPVRGHDSELLGFLVLGADITSRKRAEDAFQHSVQELQQAKERLEEQKKLLEAANTRLKELGALKDEFIATVSHEIRTPLTSIKEGVNLMLDGALGSINTEQQDFLTTVDENIDRLTELISNMLDLSKIEAGRLRLLRRRVDIRQLVESTLKGYTAIAGARTLKTHLAPVPDVFADANQIHRVLGNLISNAVKFTKETGTVLLAVQRQHQHVAVSVQDDGVGIAKEDLPKLFQKFSQVGEGENKPRGTGLGLSLSKELVERHKGTITVTSSPQRGSTFTFTLPVYQPQLALEESFAELVDCAKRTQQDAVGLVVLDGEPLVGRLPATPPANRLERLDQVAEVVRMHVHHGDAVLGIEPRWVVILAISNAEGMRAIVQRLGRVMPDWMDKLAGTSVGIPIRLGTAIYPADGTTIQRLFEQATGRLNQGLAATEQAVTAG
jgi:PAS domain S-box-containing protein